MARKITIKIDKQGKTQVDLEGFKGEECVDWTNRLADALGKKVHSEKKEDYYASVESEERQEMEDM